MRILIVKTGALGDIFFALPAPTFLKQLLRKKSSDEKVTVDWMVGKSFVPLLKGHPDIDHLIEVDTEILHHGSIAAKMREALRLRSKLTEKYDRIFIFHRSKAYLLPLLGKGPITIMSRDQQGIRFSIQSVLTEPMKIHESLAIKKTILEAFATNSKDLPDWKASVDYLLPPNAVRLGSTNSMQNPTVIGIHLGGGQNTGHEFTLKRWPFFTELIKLILSETQSHLRLFGAPSETNEANSVMAQLNTEETSRVQNRVGRTGLSGLVAEIAQVQIFIGPDSGPLHIADALEVPSLGLYGPTSAISWGLLTPRSKTLHTSLFCQPCYKDDGIFPECINNHQCMKQLSPQHVLDQLKSL